MRQNEVRHLFEVYISHLISVLFMIIITILIPFSILMKKWILLTYIFRYYFQSHSLDYHIWNKRLICGCIIILLSSVVIFSWCWWKSLVGVHVSLLSTVLNKIFQDFSLGSIMKLKYVDLSFIRSFHVRHFFSSLLSVLRNRGRTRILYIALSRNLNIFS